MDIYTTCFTLPRSVNAASTLLEPALASSMSPTGTSRTHNRNSDTNTSISSLSRRHDRRSGSGSSFEEQSGTIASAATATTGKTNVVDVISSQGTGSTELASGSTTTTAPSSVADSIQARDAAPGGSRKSVDLHDIMHQLCVDAMAANQCLISFNPVDSEITVSTPVSPALASSAVAAQTSNPTSPTRRFEQDFRDEEAGRPTSRIGKRFSFHVSGGYQQVMSARGSILRDNPFKREVAVKVPRAEVLDGKENVKLDMRRKLDEIASLTKAHLAIVGQVSSSIGFGLEAERTVEIVITGSYENVEQARVRLLVLLDEASGLHSEVCEIDHKLHPIISGRKRCVIQTIQEETATNIYFPTPLSGVLGPKNPTLMSKQNLIFITGEYFGVQRARDMLFQVSLHKSKCIISRDTAVLPRKIDWMLTERLEEVKQIMNDNGAFISFPPIGSQASLISVYGDHRVIIERSIRAVMQLACQFHVASFWLLPASFDVFMPPPSINPAQIPPILRHIAVSSGAEAVFRSNCFELHGLEHEVRAAVQLVLELDLVKQFHHEIRFQIELANEHREFISGKKNGKLNKIMKSANVKIKFETFNDYNFLIDIAGSDDTGALLGLSMLQEELPAEISFHVPEAYHKRIIGVGGKNIQRIMKKYGVYVKFSNAEEFAQLGGYTDNEDNVIARTPAKNAINLEHLKQSVMELVSPKDKDFVVESVSIPRRYHRTLLGEKSIFIHDIEAKTNSAVRFPNKETASDVVSIFGPESQVHVAAQMLLDHVPFEAEYRLPHSAEMAALTLSQDFIDLTERIKRDLNITILPWVDRSGSGEETIIKFCLNRSNVDFLSTARDLVEEYLVKREISLYPGSLRPRSDSFADSFPFFNSKLLSNRQESQPDRSNLRMAVSSPNIKALFDANPIAGGPSSVTRAPVTFNPPRSPANPDFQHHQQRHQDYTRPLHPAQHQFQHPHQPLHNARHQPDFTAFYPSPYLSHAHIPAPAQGSPYIPNQRLPVSVPPGQGQNEYHWPQSRQQYPGLTGASTYHPMTSASVFGMSPSQAPQSYTPAPVSHSVPNQVRRSFEEPDGPAGPVETGTDTAASGPDRQHQQQRQHRSSASQGTASASGPAIEAKLKEIARGAGRTQSLDLSSQSPSVTQSGLGALSGSGSGSGSGIGHGISKSSVGTTPARHHHVPSASVDHVGRTFSHLGL